MIPCKQDKCILLAICKPKEDITCDILFDYYDLEVAKGEQSKKEAWQLLNQTFPNLDHIMIKIGPQSGYSYFRDQ